MFLHMFVFPLFALYVFVCLFVFVRSFVRLCLFMCAFVCFVPFFLFCFCFSFSVFVCLLVELFVLPKDSAQHLHVQSALLCACSSGGYAQMLKCESLLPCCLHCIE